MTHDVSSALIVVSDFVYEIEIVSDAMPNLTVLALHKDSAIVPGMRVD